MMAEIVRKTFNEIYPDYESYTANVLAPLTLTYNLAAGNGNDLPYFLDDSKMFYSKNAIFTFLSNRYDDSFAVNSEEKTHKLMRNALATLLPALYVNTLRLRNDYLDKLNVDNLFSDVEDTYNVDADNNFSERINLSSEAFNQTNGDNFNIDETNLKTKEMIRDKTRRRKEFINVGENFQSLSFAETTGLIDDFINSYQFSSLWDEYYDDNITYNLPINVSYLHTFFNPQEFQIKNSLIDNVGASQNLKYLKQFNPTMPSVGSDFRTRDELEKIVNYGDKIELNYVRYDETQGAWTDWLFSGFVVQNNTGTLVVGGTSYFYNPADISSFPTTVESGFFLVLDGVENDGFKGLLLLKQN